MHHSPFLEALGDRVRTVRARRGFTRRAVAESAGSSVRHLANLELGVGNVSILLLADVASALDCPLAELLGDLTTANPEWMLLRELLGHADEETLRRVRLAVGTMLATGSQLIGGERPVALIGLRGAGKSTLGRMLADDLDLPFVELSREIEALAGCSTGEVQALYGASAYRRYERRALEAVLDAQPKAVIAAPGGLVSEPATFGILLRRTLTVWLEADPEDHLNRVAAQGDLRPMAASREALADLKGILAGRTPFYAKAELSLDTSAQPLGETFGTLRALVREALASKAAHGEAA